MPKCTVLCRVDAFVDYTAEVEADTAEEAAYLAQEDSGSLEWTNVGETEFDARVYVALDANGVEIESTQCGDF
jgi:hypothetical protein